MATTLVLVRHGETAWNRERRVQGQLDAPLNDEGLRQAQATAWRLAAEPGRWDLGPGAEIVASDLQRAWHTAQCIAERTGLPLRADPALRERHWGSFQGMLYVDIHRDHAEVFERWSREPEFAVPGGESMAAFYRRCTQALTALAAQARGTLVVVTHGGVLDCAYRLAEGIALTEPRRHPLPNAALNRLRWDGERFRVLDWGDVSHWQQAPPDGPAVSPPLA